jgi:hypothetical protein
VSNSQLSGIFNGCNWPDSSQSIALALRTLTWFDRPVYHARWPPIAMRLLRKIGLKMLVIDEAHQLLAGSYRQQRRALNLLKGLTNELMIPVIAVGTEVALHAIQSDPQVASRFDPLHLALWSESDAFRNFIVTFGKQLPLRKASPFADREVSTLGLKRRHHGACYAPHHPGPRRSHSGWD